MLPVRITGAVTSSLWVPMMSPTGRWGRTRDEQLKGRRVEFTATVEVSDNDPVFGFYSRPSKGVTGRGHRPGRRPSDRRVHRWAPTVLGHRTPQGRDRDGTKALIGVLLLHRTLPTEAVLAGIDAAVGWYSL